jgi:hypothetical protein
MSTAFGRHRSVSGDHRLELKPQLRPLCHRQRNNTFTLGLYWVIQHVQHTQDSINISLSQYSIQFYVPFANNYTVHIIFFSIKGHIKASKYFLEPNRLATYDKSETFVTPLFSQSKQYNSRAKERHGFYIRVLLHKENI